MPLSLGLAPQKSRLGVLLDHLSTIDDPRDVRRITHPLAEILLLVVCATMADCDDRDHIAAWGEAHLDFLRRHLPYEHGTPGGRWLTILIGSYRVPGWWQGRHATRPATRAPSKALPRRRALHELEEAGVKRPFVLRDAPVRAQLGAQQGPEPLHCVDVHLANAISRPRRGHTRRVHDRSSCAGSPRLGGGRKWHTRPCR